MEVLLRFTSHEANESIYPAQVAEIREICSLFLFLLLLLFYFSGGDVWETIKECWIVVVTLIQIVGIHSVTVD